MRNLPLSIIDVQTYERLLCRTFGMTLLAVGDWLPSPLDSLLHAFSCFLRPPQVLTTRKVAHTPPEEFHLINKYFNYATTHDVDCLAFEDTTIPRLDPTQDRKSR